MTQPLHSNSLSRAVTATTSYSAPVPRIGTFHLARSTHLIFSLVIATTGSHVPHKSLMESHAVFMPDVTRPGHRFPPHLSWSSGILQFRQSLSLFDTSITIRLRSSLFIIPDGVRAPPFPSTFTTKALYLSSLRWFATCSYQPIARGLSLISHAALYFISEDYIVTHSHHKSLTRSPRRPRKTNR